jgi:hypothetical protein
MSPLTDLIDSASSEDVSVTGLLRKLKVIAARLGNVQLASWVDHELTGYPVDVELPPYRSRFAIPVVGHFIGPGGAQYTDAPIPSAPFPPNLRDGWLFHHEVRQPLAELERLLDVDGPLGSPWDTNVVAMVNGMIERGEMEEIYPFMGLVSARRQLNPALIVRIVEAVRGRVLELALSIEEIQPTAGEPGVTTDPDQLKQIGTVVNNYVYGQANIAIDSTNVSQSISVTQGDRPALLAALSDAGATDDELDGLVRALELDKAEGETGMGERVRAWLGDLTMKAFTAGATSTASALAPRAAEALGQYFGIGG